MVYIQYKFDYIDSNIYKYIAINIFNRVFKTVDNIFAVQQFVDK